MMPDGNYRRTTADEYMVLIQHYGSKKYECVYVESTKAEAKAKLYQYKMMEPYDIGIIKKRRRKRGKEYVDCDSDV